MYEVAVLVAAAVTAVPATPALQLEDEHWLISTRSYPTIGDPPVDVGAVHVAVNDELVALAGFAIACAAEIVTSPGPEIAYFTAEP